MTTKTQQSLLNRWQEIAAEMRGYVGSTPVSSQPMILPKDQPTMYMDGDEILTPEQLSEWLQIPVSTVRDLCRTRAQKRDRHPLPLHHIGKRVRFYRSEIVSWLSHLSEN